MVTCDTTILWNIDRSVDMPKGGLHYTWWAPDVNSRQVGNFWYSDHGDKFEVTLMIKIDNGLASLMPSHHLILSQII